MLTNRKYTSEFCVRFVMPLSLLMKLTKTERLVYLAFLSFANNGRGQCYPGYRLLGQRAKVGKSTACRAVKLLVKRGILKIVGKRETKGGLADIIESNLPWMMAKASQNESESVPPQGQKLLKETNKVNISNDKVDPSTTVDIRDDIRGKHSKLFKRSV